MKIIYSAEYDVEHHLPLTDSAPCLLDTTYVGNAGLLAQLELRLGIYPPLLSEMEREAAYLTAIRKHCSGAFYEKAALSDELGTAHNLLQWRDALVMAGWTRSVKGISKKMDDMAALETDFVGNGAADQWLAIKVYAEQQEFTLPEFQIVVENEQGDLPALIQQCLSALEPHGVKVSYQSQFEPQAQSGTALAALQKRLINPSAQTGKITPDESLQLLSFNSQLSANEWFAAQQQSADTVVVCEDSTSLNHQLISWNRPQIYVQSGKANPQITQLFKLGFSLFARPVNVYNVLSYLQLPIHPIPARLRYQLAAILCEEGGIGERWHQTIDKYQFDEDADKNEEIRQRKEIFWKVITSSEITPEEIPYEMVERYNKNLLLWADAYASLVECDESTRAQLGSLASFCKAFSIILMDRQPIVTQQAQQHINAQQLQQLTRGIYRTSSFVYQRPQQDSVTCLPALTALTAPVGHLVWLDAVSKDPEPYPYDFLSISEKKNLAAAGIHIPEYRELLKMEHRKLLRGISRIQQRLTLVSFVYKGNEMTHEHALVSELKQMMGDAFKPCQPATTLPEKVSPLDLRTPQLAMELKQIPWVEREQSNTSIDALIQHPFDYVMRYIAKLNEPSAAELKDLKTTKGQVAHYYVEQWMKMAENDVRTMRRNYETQFEADAENAIMAKGAILQLKENQMTKMEFLQQLHESIGALLCIIETQRLHPVGCEYEVAVDDFFGFGPFRARIDCLLQNAQGEYVIFDFKWSESKEYYDKKIEKNQSIQLTLYKWAVEQAFLKKVAAVGYYLFPKRQLVTSDLEADPSEYILRLAPAEDAFQDIIGGIVNSVRYRKKELAAGHLEEGELQTLSDLPYMKEAETKHLVPLDEQYKQKGKKSSPLAPSFPHEGKFQNQMEIIPTTHSILKARLK